MNRLLVLKFHCRIYEIFESERYGRVRLQFYLRSAALFERRVSPTAKIRHGASVDVEKNLKDVQAANVNAGINSE